MTRLARSTPSVEHRLNRRPERSRFGDLGARLAQSFSASKADWDPWEETRLVEEDPPEYDEHVGPEYDERGGPEYDEPPLTPFPVTRQGYDCQAVDGHLAELEAQLAEHEEEIAALRARAPAKAEVAAEIERIGKQTSAILLAAQEQAQRMTREAQDEARTKVADAASYAAALTEEAKQQLEQIERDQTSLLKQRARVIEEMRGTVTDLSSLAEAAAQRYELPG